LHQHAFAQTAVGDPQPRAREGASDRLEDGAAGQHQIGALDPEGAIHVRFLDRAGNYHTDGLHVVERVRRTGPDHLLYQATIEDPNVYTRPWTISMPLYRRQESNAELLEYDCLTYLLDETWERPEAFPYRK